MTETSETAGRVAWFEAPTADSSQARNFYSGLFGWTFDQFGTEDYYITNEGGGAIAGNPDGKGLIVYFGSSDIEGSIGRVRELGGTATAPQAIPGVGTYSLCTDVDGNAFGLYADGDGS